MRALAALIVLFATRRAGAQDKSILEHLNLDRLQVTSLGVSIGSIKPTQVAATSVYGFAADYGEIASGLRVLFGASFWQSRYTDAVVQNFVNSLQGSIVGGTATTRVAPSRISIYDVTINAEFRWIRPAPIAIKPFIGFGAAAHVLNAEGTLINGTFVERSLDNIAAGMFVAAGVQFRPISAFGVEGQLRGDLLSGYRSVQARAGANYFFGRVRSAKP